MKLSILAVGAHPDDVELSCSGTLLRHIALGYRAGILDLTKGELGTRGTPEIRMEESALAARILGLSYRENLGFRDGFFRNDEEHQMAVIKILRHCRPDVVMANATYDRHPDHARAAQLVKDSIFLSGLAKIETEFEGKKQEAFRPKSCFNYVQSLEIKADFVVDISDYMEKKIESVLAYQSQFHNPKSIEGHTFISSPEFMEFVKARASHYGVPAGFRYAEGFTAAQPLGISDLMKI